MPKQTAPRAGSAATRPTRLARPIRCRRHPKPLGRRRRHPKPLGRRRRRQPPVRSDPVVVRRHPKPLGRRRRPTDTRLVRLPPREKKKKLSVVSGPGRAGSGIFVDFYKFLGLFWLLKPRQNLKIIKHHTSFKQIQNKKN